MRPHIEPDLTHAESQTPADIAREQFAHGVLETFHLDQAADRERRIGSMITALERDAAPIRIVWTRFRWRVLSGVAAVIALSTLIILGLPTQTTASAIVQASLKASQSAGDRRYEVRSSRPREEQVQQEPIATLDVRDANHTLMVARTPFGDRIVLGHNDAGVWAIKPDGTIDRYPPRQVGPRWIDFGQSTVLLASVEELMTSLEKSYTLERGDAAATGDGPLCDRITARRKLNPSPEPVRIELWIDRTSHVVRRMELHWNPPRQPRPQGPGGGERPIEADGADRLGPEHPDGPPPPEGRRPPRRQFDRPEHPEGPPPEGEFRPDGLGPPDGPPDGPRRRPRHPPPEFLGGPPDFEGGRRPPPPRLLVFELVEHAPFEDKWFDPETHATEPKQDP